MERAVAEVDEVARGCAEAEEPELAVALGDLDAVGGAGAEGVGAGERLYVVGGERRTRRRTGIAERVEELVDSLGGFPAGLGVGEETDAMRPVVF